MVLGHQHTAGENNLSRRRFMHFASGLSVFALSVSQASGNEPFSPPNDPFTLGVASGDPDDHSVVLWTRLATAPLEPGGGLPPEFVEVRWEVAADDSMNNVIASGTVTATPQL